jgi:V/A-type H+/Na+-transporting ATPase subunit I
MIINVKKHLIFGLKNEMSSFFKKAQKAGFIEFISKQPKVKEISENVKDILSAIKTLKKQPLLEQVLATIDSITLSHKVIQIQNKLQNLEDKKKHLLTEIARVSPFGDFDLDNCEEVMKLSNRTIQFLAAKKEKIGRDELPLEVIYINTAYDLDYFIAFNKDKKTYPKMIEMQIDEPIGILKSKLEFVDEQLRLETNKLKSYAKYINYLKEDLKNHLNMQHLNQAKRDVSFEMSEQIFAVEAWIPVNKLQYLTNMIKDSSIEFEEIQVESKDTKPTYMENSGWGKVGEDLVHIYDTPSFEDKDPSSWVLVFFAIFFSMIVSDAGYGLLYLALGLVMKLKFKAAKGMLKRFINLVLLLSTGCIIWGTLTASFFGIELAPNNSLRKASLLHFIAKEKTTYHINQQDDVYKEWSTKYPLVKDVQSSEEFLLQTEKMQDGEVKYEARDEFYDNILMEFSILIGVIHLALSFLRYLRRNWSGLGWIIFMIGGYLYFPSQLNATSFVQYLNLIDKNTAYFFGEYLIYSGIFLACFCAFLQRGIAAGIFEIMNLIQVFADVLSYLRLYALALAGMIMASTFNDIGLSIGLKAGFIVIIIGHLVNISLGIMGGIIHGLRLNFLEWYHYSFEGGGKNFRPLKLFK